MNKYEFSSFREVRENLNRLMHKLLKTAQSPQSEELNLNSSQIQVILVLNKYNALKMCDLTRKTNLVKSSMTSIVDSLEALSLVQRVRNENDRRIIFVDLTSTGHTLAKSLKKSISDSFDERINYLNKEERDDFFKTLNKLSLFLNKMENKND